jgi:AraC family transcriptional regulator of adaptative response / DNA-3-methyladenine glycosylase II
VDHQVEHHVDVDAPLLEARQPLAAPSIDGATLSVRLTYRKPFDWQRMLAFFAGRATAGVESVVGNRYSRTVSLKDGHGIIEVQPDESDGFLRLTLRGIKTAALFEVVQRCRELFDLDAPVADIAAVLGKDVALAKLLKQHSGVRVPGCWDGFELTVRAILGQQVSVKAATTIAGRIASTWGETLALPEGIDHDELRCVFPDAERLVRARLENVGIIRSRTPWVRARAGS